MFIFRLSTHVLFLATIFASLAEAMYSKRALPALDELPAAKRFRRNVGDLFLGNQVSGQRTMSLLEDAVAAGTKNIGDLLGNTSSSSAINAQEKWKDKNAGRDLKRRLLKKSLWPRSYIFELPVWDKEKQCATKAKISMMLIHELIFQLMKTNDKDQLLNQPNLGCNGSKHLNQAAKELGLQASEKLLAIGIWSDGVPFNWDRTESLEVVSMSLPGLGGSGPGMSTLQQFRVPLCAIPKKFLIKEETMDAIFSVVAWSMCFGYV